MHRSSIARAAAIGAALMLLASVAHALLSPASERGWRPAVLLTGEGDATRAVAALRAAAGFWQTTLLRTEVDPQTRSFLTRAMASLQDFDLQGMYALLPDRDGAFRELRMFGKREGQRYLVGRPATADFEVGAKNTALSPGDSSLRIRARPVAAHDGDTHYLIRARGGIALGQLSWPAVLASNRAWLRMADANIDADAAARPMVGVRLSALKANPALGPTEVELVGTLWEAFPRMSYLLSSLGHIEDLVASPSKASAHGATHLHVVLRMDAARMRESYPELAAYLLDLDELLRADIAWVDSSGRSIAKAHVDSEKLEARLELYVKDGQVVPFKGDQVFVDEPIDPSVGARRYSMQLSAAFKMMGVSSQLRGGRVDFDYEPSARGAELRASMTHIPQVSIDGAALGIIPTGVIDTFIPGNLHDLIQAFLTTACKGNEGRGVAFSMRMQQRETGISTLDGDIGFEALDNFLVKLGVGFFNDHVMPDHDVSADVSRLMVATQSAFSADVERYARAH